MTDELNMNEMEQVSGGMGGSSKKLAPKVGFIVYQIKRGDTLGKIARTYGTTAEKIKACNSTISNVNDITAGFWIYIPA